MQVSIDSKSSMDNIKCGKEEECFFKLDISKLLSKLNLLSEDSRRLKGSIKSVRYDLDSLESELNCIKSDIENIKHDMRGIESFLLVRIRYSSAYISLCCKCCLTNLRRKKQTMLRDYR